MWEIRRIFPKHVRAQQVKLKSEHDSFTFSALIPSDQTGFRSRRKSHRLTASESSAFHSELNNIKCGNSRCHETLKTNKSKTNGLTLVFVHLVRDENTMSYSIKLILTITHFVRLVSGSRVANPLRAVHSFPASTSEPLQ